MSKEVYGFEITDNDHVSSNGYMLYTNKKGLLTPAIEEFQKGLSTFFNFDNMINVLKNNKISQLITYFPQNLDTICKHPYEITNDDDFEACKDDGNWNKYNHSEIYLNKEKVLIFKKNNIKLKKLSNKEISELERTLKFHK